MRYIALRLPSPGAPCQLFYASPCREGAKYQSIQHHLAHTPREGLQLEAASQRVMYIPGIASSPHKP